MWLSRTIAARQRAERESAAADMGVTTIGGSSASVMTRGEQRGGSASVMTKGEQRNLEVFAPGGLIWQPQAGDTVLVIKGGTGGQEQCVVAANTAAASPEELVPGELFLYSCGGASVYLRMDGSIAIKGNADAEGNWVITGDVDLTGKVKIAGSVELQGPVAVNGAVTINGSLTVNGQPCRPCLCG